MNTKQLSALALLPLVACGGQQASETPSPAEKNNLLFLLIDDLRPELGCYGNSEVLTPNIDALAASGTQFQRAYSNIPVSGASRASLLTGLRPKEGRFISYYAEIDKDAPEVPTIGELFKNNGLTTHSNGKVVHHASTDALRSWTEQWMPHVKIDYQWENYLTNTEYNPKVRYFTECLDVPDSAYYDGKTTLKAIADLRKFKESGERFFLAVGLLKPHLPFNAPKKYWDMYDSTKITLPATDEMDRSGFPANAFHNWGEIRSYTDVSWTEPCLPHDQAIRMIHGYRACVSYTDAQVGLILDELKALGLDKNTTVVLIGDHGWSLGDHGEWCKHSNFEKTSHVPTMIAGPGIPVGKKIDLVTESIDLYPTFCDLVGVAVPEHCQGNSLMPLINGNEEGWDNTALIQWNNGRYGRTLITQTHEYTEWRDKEGEVIEQMLFDHQADPEEVNNIASDNKALCDEMSADLQARFAKVN